MWFDKKNGMHLFTLFIFLGAMTFITSSYIFVRNQTTETAKIINNENLKGKFSAIEQYVTEFIESHQRSLYKITNHPYVIGTVLEGGSEKNTLKDQLSLIKPYELTTFVNLYDFTGKPIYEEFTFRKEINSFITEGVSDESILDSNRYIFFNSNKQNYLLITEPVKYNALAEGLTAFVIKLDDSHLIERLIADNHHWFGISQSKFNWTMTAPQGWKVQSKLIPAFDISLLYASSPEVIAKTESEFLSNLFIRMAAATFITIFLLYFLGRKILVSPFQSLARSEQLLEKQTRALKVKEAESTRLARVAKYMKDAVVFTDTDINITWVNEAFEEMTGFQKSEVLGLKPAHIFQGEDTDPDTINKMREAINQQQFGSFEIINYHKNRQAYWLELHITPLFDNAGKIEAFMAIQRDITERKELENILKDSVKKAQAANIAKSQFLASMSHELRTPMNGVLGMSELIKDSALTKAQQDMVNTLLSSGKHMLSVLNDILDFSKIEAGKLSLNLSSFYISDLENDIINMYQPLCHEKGLTFNLTPYKDKHEVCIADKTRIQQILQNLLNNAWKFTLEGHISVSITLIDNDQNPSLVLQVTDTGIGISKDKQTHIFQPFSQAESDTTRRFGGTGLGLSIILELVNAMKGSIEVLSDLGEGSRFKVIIPIKIGERTQDIKKIENSVFDGSGLKVLIVEDNKVNVTVMSMFLQKRGFTCEVAENGQIGVDKVKSMPFDLVIMDNHMPIMDGIDATKAIKALALAHEPIIIGCTADAFEQTRDDMIKVGCTDVVTKPIHSSTLDEVLLACFTSK